MTGKQIINEIDISKCEFCYSGEYCHIYSGTADFKWMCKENEDCQIKKLLLQLKRAEQKLAKIKEYCKPKVIMNGTANVILKIIEGKENG